MQRGNGEEPDLPWPGPAPRYCRARYAATGRTDTEAFAVMTDFERRLQAAMESAVANQQPPRNLIQQVRRRHRRRTARAGVAGAAAAVAVAVLVPVGIRASGHGSGPAGPHRPKARPTVYVAYPNAPKAGTIIPIRIATNKPGKPIRLRFDGFAATTLDGKTLYVPTGDAVIPVSTATNTPGKPIHLGADRAFTIDINPNGTTAYVAGIFTDKITPINTATNTPGKAIHVRFGIFPVAIAFTPDGKTAYVRTLYDTITPINTATGTLGKPIHVGRGSDSLAVTP